MTLVWTPNPTYAGTHGELPFSDPWWKILAIINAIIAVACSDIADPFWRGQGATPPATGELTLAERVVKKWVLPEAPNAGLPYTADISWEYQRFTTGASFQRHHGSVFRGTSNMPSCCSRHRRACISSHR